MKTNYPTARTNLHKQGNGATIYLRKELLEQTGWKAGDSLSIYYQDDKVIIVNESKETK